MKELVIEAEVDNLDKVFEFIDSQLEKYDCPPKIQWQINLAVEELFVNIAHYAYHPNKGSATIKFDILEDSSMISIIFIDEGKPYNPLEKPDPDISLPAEERDIGGLGIFMVKKYVDNIFYKYHDGKNILTIQKHLKEMK